MVCPDSFTRSAPACDGDITTVCVHVLTLSQGAIQLAGRSEPGGSADRGGDHDPRLLP